MTLLMLAAALALVVVIMTAVWIASVRLNNAGIVDVAWSANFGLIAILYAILGTGDLTRRLMAAGMMLLWSARLALHLGRRVFGHLETEDGRYAKLRADWGAAANRKMLAFFHFQGVTNVVLSVPVLLACMNPRHGLGVLEYAGIAIWIVALAGESIADAQLSRFKSKPENRGHVCAEGLWRYSRHPNYFFEWLVWIAYFLFALASPWGWLSFYCPLLMFWFLYKVTGIPATEEHSVGSKGEEYRRYQRKTSPFIPWFPKHDSEGVS
jgi:steroid 5-alpha reductase family enzyme